MAERIFIGVAWPYANGPLHLGHVAGCYLPADIFARYHRLLGDDVLMVSGSDSHGTPITLRAEAEGLDPSEVVGKYHASFLASWEQLGITFDLFTSTMTENHRRTVEEIILSLQKRGYIYRDTMKVAYSPDFERFLPDRYVQGTCPRCGHPDARGDQCDNCGITLDPVDLIGPVHVRSGVRYPVEVRDAEHLFFRLSAFTEALSDWIEPKDHWRANVRNFTRGILREGLKDRAVSRDIEWGIPIPIAGFEDKRVYVWFEAVMGYLSASKEWAAQSGSPDAWRPYWEDEATKAYYFIGKDNIPFHTIIWPGMLKGDGRFVLPYDVPANEYLTLEGRQFSTSRNWALWVPDYLERFPPDPLRYYLSANMPEYGDTDFSWREFLRRNNDELVATYGNLVHRVLTLTYRNFEGRVPESAPLDAADVALRERADAALEDVGRSLAACRFREALGRGAMALAGEANRYIDFKEPWRTAREDRATCAATLSTALYVISALKTLLYPFLPFSSERLHGMLGFSGSAAEGGWAVRPLEPGQPLQKPEPLFVKLDDSVVDAETARLERQHVEG